MTQRSVKPDRMASAAFGSLAPQAPAPGAKSGRRSAHRLRWLLGALAVVLGVGAMTRAPALKTWWLERQSLESLRAQADLPATDALTRFLYARRLFRSGRGSEALAVLQRAEALLPARARDEVAEAIEAHEGYLLARNAQGKKAVFHLERARAMNDNDPLVYLGLGQVLEHQGKFEAADAQYRVVIGLDEKNAEGWYRLGRSANAEHKPQQAVEPLQRALALRPDSAEMSAESGHAYAYQRQFTQALPLFRRALALDPANADYRLYCGMALSECAQSADEYQEALELLKKSALADPQNENVERAMGALALRFNALPQARDHLTRCVQLDHSDTDGWYHLAQAEKRIGNEVAYRHAIVRFQTLTQLHNDQQILEKRVQVMTQDAPLRLALARHYAKQGNLVGAAQQCRYTLLLQPRNADAAQEYRALSQQIQRLTTERGFSLSQLGALGPPLSEADIASASHSLPPPESSQDGQRVSARP